MKFLILTIACLAAQAIAAPSRALEDDVAAARQEAVAFSSESLDFASSCQGFDQAIDLVIRPLSGNILGQLANLNIPANDISQIETDFDTSFTAIQETIRDLERTIKETEKTLRTVIADLDGSNWNNLRVQVDKLTAEIADIDTRYAQAVEDINTSNAALEADLTALLEGQDAAAIAEVLATWQQIVDAFNAEVSEVDAAKILYDTRGASTLAAIDVVLDQVV